MPIYEYRCDACGRKASIFFRSMSAVEAEPECPHCGERRLERKMSTVWSHRSPSDDAYPQPVYEDEGVPFYGADPFSDPYGYGDSPEDGYDESGESDGSDEDVAAMAREARVMAQMMGQPLDESFDAALRHVEQGADPDEVFGELDAAESAQEPPPVESDP